MSAIKAMIDHLMSGVPPIDAPAGLRVLNTTNSSVSLAWLEVRAGPLCSADIDAVSPSKVAGAAGFDVYRDHVRVNTAPVVGYSYTDDGLSSGTTFNYHVIAIAATGGTR